jgi:hypothetical protein
VSRRTVMKLPGAAAGAAVAGRLVGRSGTLAVARVSPGRGDHPFAELRGHKYVMSRPT